MGRDIGCEYTQKCDCLEYAAVDENRIKGPEEKAAYNLALEIGGSTIGFPKKFPYFAAGTKIQRAGCLVPFYLNSRRPIYECNDKCKCGPHCRNKNVQFGRTVELEIFKTASRRGWGLRCKQKLFEGQFIDTYRGEIITDEEATRREESATSKAKASYLYSLDKFAESEDIATEDIYVVDGEFMGGPTKFINHSCEPNCRQYTVSYNKHDAKVYDIAFFACRDIEKGEELTFDYLDKEEGEEMDDPGEGAIPCLCGAKKCRKWLWT
jgi:histone-lysine N-methyltransferase SUV39H